MKVFILAIISSILFISCSSEGKTIYMTKSIESINVRAKCTTGKYSEYWIEVNGHKFDFEDNAYIYEGIEAMNKLNPNQKYRITYDFSTDVILAVEIIE